MESTPEGLVTLCGIQLALLEIASTLGRIAEALKAATEDGVIVVRLHEESAAGIHGAITVETDSPLEVVGGKGDPVFVNGCIDTSQ